LTCRRRLVSGERLTRTAPGAIAVECYGNRRSLDELGGTEKGQKTNYKHSHIRDSLRFVYPMHHDDIRFSDPWFCNDNHVGIGFDIKISSIKPIAPIKIPPLIYFLPSQQNLGVRFGLG
jgi:hypothetical protein